MATRTDVAGVVEDWISAEYRGLDSADPRLRARRSALDADGVEELPGLLTPAAHALLKDQIT